MAFELIDRKYVNRATEREPMLSFSKSMVTQRKEKVACYKIYFNVAAKLLFTHDRVRPYYDAETNRLGLEPCSVKDGNSIGVYKPSNRGGWIAANTIARVIGEEPFGKSYPCYQCNEGGYELIVVDLNCPIKKENGTT